MVTRSRSQRSDVDGPALDITPLMLASRAVTAAVVRALESVGEGLSVSQMRVLVLLWTGEPLNLSAVAAGLGVNASNASRTCERLVASGLVARGTQAHDRRQVALTLTPRGRRLVQRLMRSRERQLAAILGRMDDGDQRRLLSALEPFNAAAQADLWPSHEEGDGRDPRLLGWGI